MILMNELNTSAGTGPPQGLEFPCDYPIKAMGRAEPEFEQAVTEIVARHVDQVPAHAVRTRNSRAGNFVSVTVTVKVTSRAQLEDIYQDLGRCERVLWTL